jgi:biotin operon repressor
MSKTTKYFDLFSALKAGGDKGVTPDALAKSLNFTTGALAVYIHALRHKFGAVIESVRNGRTVVSYRLVNVAEMEAAISPNRKPRTTKAKKAAPAKAKATKATKTKVKAKKVAKTAPVKKTKVRDDGPVEVLDEDLDIAEITDRELDDIRSQLGIA